MLTKVRGNRIEQDNLLFDVANHQIIARPFCTNPDEIFVFAPL